MLQVAAPLAPLSTFWRRRAFSIGDRTYLWIDVALDAMAHGDWGDFERRLTAGLACAAEAGAQGLDLDDQVEAALTAFRYERDLIAAADLDAWLERAAITTDEWVDCLRRDVLRRRWDADLERLIDLHPISPRQLEAAAVAEGVCSGTFDRFAEAFAGRAALALDAGSAEPAAGDALLAERAAGLARQHAHWMATRAEGDVVSRLTDVLRIADTFRTVAARLASPDVLADVVRAHRLDWVVVEIDAIAFATENAAREALLCIRADGLSMPDVAVLSRKSVTRTRLFIEDVPAQYRDLLMSAGEGQSIGPLEIDGSFSVFAILGRSAPGLDVEGVADRARRTAVDRAMQQAARDRVQR